MVDAFIQDISKIAQENIEKDDYLQPMAFIIKEGEIVPMSLSNTDDEAKFRSYTDVGLVAQKLAADKVILLADVAARIVDNPEDAKYVQENYSTESPLSYPESLRLDGILFLVVELKSGTATGYFRRYEKHEIGYKFHELETYSETFSGGLVNMVMGGFNFDLEN